MRSHDGAGSMVLKRTSSRPRPQSFPYFSCSSSSVGFASRGPSSIRSLLLALAPVLEAILLGGVGEMAVAGVDHFLDRRRPIASPLNAGARVGDELDRLG